MENSMFKLKYVANIVEMAPSSSKMLQIVWKVDRTGQKKKMIRKKKSLKKLNPFYKMGPPNKIKQFNPLF